MEIPDRLVPEEFRRRTLALIQEADDNAREETGLFKCPIDNCTTQTVSARGLASHMTCRHRIIPPEDRKRMAKAAVEKERQETLDAMRNDHKPSTDIVILGNEFFTDWDAIASAAAEIAEAQKRLDTAKEKFRELIGNAN